MNVSLIAPAFAGKSTTMTTLCVVAVSAHAVAIIVREAGPAETTAWKVAHDCGYCNKSLFLKL